MINVLFNLIFDNTIKMVYNKRVNKTINKGEMKNE